MTIWTNGRAAMHRWVEVLVGDDTAALTTVGGDLPLYAGASAPAVTTVGGNLLLYAGASAPTLTQAQGGVIIAWGPPHVLSVTPTGEYVAGRRRFPDADAARGHWHQRAVEERPGNSDQVAHALEFLHAIDEYEATKGAN